MNNNRSKNSQLLYIEVYNKILKNIKDGLYNEDNKLPSENKLSEQMGVSRVTLRQSLMLLQEDGLIETKKGVGNFLCDHQNNTVYGLEHLGDVLKKCGITTIDQITCVPHLETANLYSNNTFERKVPILLGTNLYYYYQNKCYAHCFSIIATDLEFTKSYDLLNSEEVTQLISTDLYTHTKTCKYEIKIVEDHENLFAENFNQPNTMFILLTEKMINHQGDIIALNKYHIPINEANIRINSF